VLSGVELNHANPRRLAALIAVTAACVANPAGATTLVLEAARDTAIFADSVDYASGAGQLFVGNTAGSQPRRALLWFDLSQVPAGMRVVEASLRILVNRHAPAAPVSSMALHRLSGAWGEGGSNFGSGNGGGDQAQPGEATWRSRFHGNAATIWRQPGGDYVAAPSATLSFSGTGLFTWTGPGLAADVNTWRASPASNHGWIVIGDERESYTARRFHSRETGDAFSRPQLHLTLAPDTAAGDEDVPLPAWALGALGLGLAGALSGRGLRGGRPSPPRR
jgi:hypothetical protein